MKSATSSMWSTMSSIWVASAWMSSRSIGVTKVVLSRWMMSWVIRSPSCSALRMSRGEAAVLGPVLEQVPQQLRGAQRVLAGLGEEVEEDAVLGDE